jgi:hypothetical protein
MGRSILHVPEAERGQGQTLHDFFFLDKHLLGVFLVAIDGTCTFHCPRGRMLRGLGVKRDPEVVVVLVVLMDSTTPHARETPRRSETRLAFGMA